MNEMMEQCCSGDGRPDFDMMRRFMGRCGKNEFTDDDVEKMTLFCCGKGKPNMSRMKKMMQSCGCQIPESAEKE
jgi:hypothetical protein